MYRELGAYLSAEERARKTTPAESLACRHDPLYRQDSAVILEQRAAFWTSRSKIFLPPEKLRPVRKVVARKAA
jgi:hypothetical protein